MRRLVMDAGSPPLVRPNNDEEHLRLLSIFHYVVAGLGAVFASLPLLHVAVGVAMVAKPEGFMNFIRWRKTWGVNRVAMVAKPEGFMNGQASAAPPAWAGYFFIGVGGIVALSGWATAVCTFLSGRYLARRQKRIFSVVIAAILCAFFPFGTVLGVFTIIVLSRESVQRLYAVQ